MAAVKKVTLPSPTGNEQGSTPPKTWEQEEIAQPEYAAPSNKKDPTDNAKDIMGLDEDEARKIPGSEAPDQPWKSPPSPAPRRLRRDQ